MGGDGTIYAQNAGHLIAVGQSTPRSSDVSKH